MKISKITINNILGIDDLEFSPAGFTSIEGPNGTGKTSILEAIKATLKTGHDATLLRTGAEKGEIVFVLDDGGSITKKVGQDASSTEVRDAGGKKVPRPAEAIARLADMMSINPVAFLTAEKKDRVKVLLEAMPLVLDTEELTRISGIRVTAQPGVHALATIDLVNKQVYDERTGTNRAIKEKEATIAQLTQAMPDPVGGVVGSEDEIVEKVETARGERDTLLGKIRTKLDGIKNAAQTQIDEARVKLQADIDALKAAAQESVDGINAATAEQANKAAIATDNANNKFNDTVAPLSAALAAIRANRDTAAKREVTLTTISTMGEELEDLKQDAIDQTAALDAIAAYKSQLLSSLPIPGLEVRAGEIFRDDVAFDRLNTAQQVDVAVEIAKLRAGELGVVCVDRIECMDSEMFASFRDRLLESGLQAFVTRVGDDEFEIHTQD